MVDTPEDGESGAQPIIPGLSEKDSLKAAILIQVPMRLACGRDRFTDRC